MKITYDKSANAVYISFEDNRESVKSVDTDGEWPFNVDIDDKGNILGIEIMDADTVLSADFLNKAEKIG